MVYPKLRVVLIAPEGSAMLRHYSKLIFVTTLSIYEDHLMLTTVKVKVQDVTVPVAFFLHSHRLDNEYAYFFKTLKDLSGDWMSPSTIIGDQEDGLRIAAEQVFPSATYNIDYFCFMQANTQWLQRNQGDCHVKAFIGHLRELIWALSPNTLQHKLNNFTSIWTKRFAPFARYFDQQWVRHCNPALWAAFGRPAGLPMGDQHFEDWNQRLQTLFFVDVHMPIDYVVRSLHKEWQHHWTLIAKQNPAVLLHVSASSSFASAINNNTLAGTEFSTPTTSSSSSSFVTTTPDCIVLDSSPEPSPPPSPLPFVSIGLVPPTRTRCECGDGFVNQSCSIKHCISCCSSSPTHCTVAGHQMAKASHRKSPSSSSANCSPPVN